jgi:hypothetical protein
MSGCPNEVLLGIGKYSLFARLMQHKVTNLVSNSGESNVARCDLYISVKMKNSYR